MLIKRAIVKDNYPEIELNEFKGLPSSELVDMLIRKGYKLRHKYHRVLVLENNIHRIYLFI